MCDNRPDPALDDLRRDQLRDDPRPSGPPIGAGFDFARQLRDPDFRQHLKNIGHDGHPVIIAQPGETMGAIRERAQSSDGEGKVLVATPDSRQPHGWLLIWMDTA
jgi:hypothetical protein